MPPKTTRVTVERADANAEAIVTFRAAGQDSLNHCPADSLVYGSAAKTLKKELARMTASANGLGLDTKLNIDTLGKMRRVAQEYTPGQIDELAGRVREFASRFSTSHLIRLLAVGDRAVRDALAARAVRGSWPLALLERHVHVARGSRRPGAGRNPAVPDEDDHRLLVLEGLCLKWLRWTELAADGLPADVRKLVRTADSAVGAVQDALAKHLPRTQAAADDSGRTPRKGRRATSIPRRGSSS